MTLLLIALAVLGLAEIVDVDDVRMLEHRRHPRLFEQHVDERLLRREVRVDELDDDELLEPGRSALDRELDLGHAALADLGDQLVPSESGGARAAGLPQRSHVQQCSAT